MYEHFKHASRGRIEWGGLHDHLYTQELKGNLGMLLVAIFEDPISLAEGSPLHDLHCSH